MYFYLTLFYQDVDGWSALRTGLSWLFMNIPFLVMAQSAGRPARQVAIGQARNVASARIGPVTRALGTSYRAAAKQAFSHGYQVALLIAGLGLIAAAILAAFGLRDNRRPELDAVVDKPAPGDPDNLTIAAQPHHTFVTRPDGGHRHVDH